MNTMSRTACLSLGLLAVTAVSATALAKPKAKEKLKFGAKAAWVLTPQNVTASLTEQHREPFDASKAHSSARTRGDTMLFAKLAPAVAVVRTEEGHGTGFFVTADGFLVTNNHVIAHGMTYDPERKASVAQIHTGKLGADGTMTLLAKPTPAVFYKTDPQKDLALLKLTSIPPELGTAVPTVTLAKQGPRPAQNGTIVGHPGFGMLWSYRTCVVSAVGRDSDIVATLMVRLANMGARKEDVEGEPQDYLGGRRTVVSSCGASPGDSGGPLVDDQGNLLAVTYAIPPEGHFDKFTYHVHLDEVRSFLASPPAEPSILIPDAWALGPHVELMDVLGEGHAQTLAAGERSVQQLLLDLDGDSDLEPGLRAIVAKRSFEAEVAVHMATEETPATAFYDTDNDGHFDLIVEAGKSGPKVARAYALGADGRWSENPSVAGQPWLSPKYLKDKRFGAKMSRIVARITE